MSDLSRSRVPVKVEAAGDTHIGGRSHNEDALLLRPDLNLYLVADGAGGQNAGNVAASLATTTVAHFFERTRSVAEKLPEFDALGLPTAARRLATAVQEANQEILAISKHSDRHKGMGSTLVAALFDNKHRRMHVAHVGDSRCYRLRDGRLEQLTHDHSLINDVLELRPNIANERIRKLPRNVITRALGMMDNLRVSVRSYDVVPGDRFLLCSDGITDVVGREQLNEALMIDGPCDELVSLLINMSLEARSEDNIAALVIDCELPAGLENAAVARPRRTAKRRPLVPAAVLARRRSDAGDPKLADALASEEAKIPSDRPTDRGLTADEAEAAQAADEADDDDALTQASPADVGDRVSTPEIVLYEPGGEDPGRESHAHIHVVPRDSTTPPDVLQAVQHVMSADEEPGRLTRAYSLRVPKRTVSAPRLEKVSQDDPDAAQTGTTRQAPPSEAPGTGQDHAAISDQPPDGEATQQTYPDRRAAVPPMRDPLDTSDYTLDNLRPCHACGSIIAIDAERCMYCGAETGFVTGEKES